MKKKLQNWWRALMCRIFGHKCSYSGGIPSMGLDRWCECTRCGKKWVADYTGDVIRHPENIWKEVTQEEWDELRKHLHK